MRETYQNVDSSQFGAVKGSSTTFALLKSNIRSTKKLMINKIMQGSCLLTSAKSLITLTTIFSSIHMLLQDRQQRVKMNKSFSEWNTVMDEYHKVPWVVQNCLFTCYLTSTQLQDRMWMTQLWSNLQQKKVEIR